MLPEPALSPDKQHLMEHIREFAKRVKLSGTAEELASFRYLEAQMQSYGYKTELLFHDAFISLPGRARVEVMGMRKGEKDLKEKFDAAIKSAAADGVIKELSVQWSKLDLTPTF